MNKPDNISEDIWNELTTKEKEDRINGVDDIPFGFIDLNKISLGDIAEYLTKKYQFQSTGDAHFILKMVDFYKINSK